MNLGYHIGKRVFPRFTWRRKALHNEVYLSFDDGPHPEISPWVLDQLDQCRAKASFFVVGENAARYPEILNEIVKRGHSIGNHTQHHLKGWNCPAEKYLEDIKSCEAFLPERRLFRPPYGRINFKSIKKLQDYEIIMWDVLSKDYKANLNRNYSLKRICRQTRPGSIAVFHDSTRAEQNLKYLLPAYLEFLDKKGYNMFAL